jgi:hypothetical protein
VALGALALARVNTGKKGGRPTEGGDPIEFLGRDFTETPARGDPQE